MSQKKPEHSVGVLLICMGNICRSPMAHGVIRQRLVARELAARVWLDSAGTHGYHVGSPPDQRAQAAARRRGIDITDLRARLVGPKDFAEFDLILAMDEDNLEALRAVAAREYHDRIHLFLEYAGAQSRRNVPDPYYGGKLGFERVLDLVEDAADALIARLEQLLEQKARRR
jgi:protein-tyrosine phosphatase